MRKALPYIAVVFLLTACLKQIEVPPTPMPVTPLPVVKESKDSITCTPFAQHILVQLDPWHADSALLQLPCGYRAQNNTDQYPLLIFLNGTGEAADHGNLKKLKRWGPPHYMLDSLRFEFDVAGKHRPMIVVCPQSENGYRSPLSTNQVIDYMIKTYRIDTTRIYLTGLSAGAQSMLRYLTHRPEYAARIAAAVTASTTKLDSVHQAQLHYISDAHVPLNWFCGNQDYTYLKANQTYVNTINSLSPGLVQFRLYNGAHGNWNILYNPSHKYYKPNIYEWMLQYAK